MPFPSLIVLCAYSLILMVFVTGSEKPSENKFFLFDFASVDFLRIIAFGKDVPTLQGTQILCWV